MFIDNTAIKHKEACTYISQEVDLLSFLDQQNTFDGILGSRLGLLKRVEKPIRLEASSQPNKDDVVEGEVMEWLHCRIN